MTTKKLCLAALAAAAAGCGQAHAYSILLDFEGVGDLASINDFYNGGTDSAANSGVDYGVNFSSNSQALTGGNYSNNPTPPTIVLFLNGDAATMNVAAGFTDGLSFYYSSSEVASVKVWDGPGGTGSLLATLDLVAQANLGCESSAKTYCNWTLIDVSFAGVARSVGFFGVANRIALDNITIGRDTPAATTTFDTTGGDIAPGVFSTGSNAYGQPSLTFDGGTLQYSADTLTAKDALLNAPGGAIDTNGFAATISGVVSGPGDLRKIGGGTLTLSAANTYTGTTIVSAGTLTVAGGGSLAGAVQVGAGGTLGGSGRIGGSVEVAGTLAPGSSPGTLTVAGSVSMSPGSAFQEEIDGPGTGNGAGNYDRLLVGGRFVADGALNVALRGIGGNAGNAFTPALGERFRIVVAAGGIQGRFASLTPTPAGLAAGTRLDAFYNAGGSNAIDLFVTPGSYAGYVGAWGGNDNAQSAGGALDRMRGQDDANRATAQQNALRYAVAGLGAGQIAGVATLLAGEVHGAMAAAAPQSGRWLQSVLARQLDTASGRSDETGFKPGDNLWLDLHAAEGRRDDGSAASAYRASRYQFTLGGDLLRGRGSRFGLGLTYSSTRLSPESGSGTLEETAPFLYGQYTLDLTRPLVFDGLLYYGFDGWETRRPDPLRQAGLIETDASGDSVGAGLSVRSPFVFGATVVQPFARVLWQSLSRERVLEGTDSPAALDLSGYDGSGTRVLVGAAVGPTNDDPLKSAFTYRASLAVGEDFGDLIEPSVQASLAGEGLRIGSPTVGRGLVQLDLSMTYRVCRRAYVYLGLNGEARDRGLDGGVNAGIDYEL